MAEEGKKRGKKGLFALLAAIAGAVFFVKKRKGSEESAWEEATPE